MIIRIILLILFIFPMQTSARPSLESLIGMMDSTYHIRVDILNHINSNAVPFSRAWHHMIRIAQNQHHLYYESQSYEEAEKDVQENSIAQKCLALEYDREEAYQKFKQIDSMMGDTRDRREHIYEISKYYFSRRGFVHPKVTTKELYDRCNSGNYG